jgi:hypothetical protein
MLQCHRITSADPQQRVTVMRETRPQKHNRLRGRRNRHLSVGAGDDADLTSTESTRARFPQPDVCEQIDEIDWFAVRSGNEANIREWLLSGLRAGGELTERRSVRASSRNYLAPRTEACSTTASRVVRAQGLTV